MKELNKYILAESKPLSTVVDKIRNIGDSQIAARDANRANRLFVANEYLNKYFEKSGEDIQDYFNDIKKINNKKIIPHIIDEIGDLKDLDIYCNTGIEWLLCLGQELSRELYSDLFKLIDTMYGSGDGLTTFNLPKCHPNKMYMIKCL
tara:strand:+ start:409 stop:852 length:444 start_codon:yes stop_codon:yes gene_type:complete